MTQHEAAALFSMPDDLPAASRRVAAALARAGHPALIRIFPDSTRSAAEAAAAVGCPPEAIVKSLIFRRADDDLPVLALIGGADRVDTTRLATAVSGRIVRADADFVRRHTGFAIGGVPPVGHATPPVSVIDQGLFALSTVWAAAGTPHAVFQTTTTDLARIAGAITAAIAADR
ncbi:cys-tRNA(pro)/cys-tRNA(cys) deacylase [Tistrella bauzanensis]|uniref:Cys-tRNA(Pro)/cys-tRNA(Cys) deacylase n=1 Tax=Tistrella bauzanensis TaxID=657419 RepID=A0ABQ1IG22_9PROT|nr:YbaK/EbsC family protein [Tistrella bauzanensis]GGB37481.1 cys-tRNA(pro)/cys-tRNA(cys) deacylase [Tistrella bauzanensis]